MRLRLWRILRRTQSRHRARDVPEPRASREACDEPTSFLLPAEDGEPRYRIRTIQGGVFWVSEREMKAWMNIWIADPSAPDAFTILRLPEGR